MVRNAARLLKSLQAEQDRLLHQQAIENSTVFVQLAAQQGYRLNPKALTEEINFLSEEVVAAIWNSGIGLASPLNSTLMNGCNADRFVLSIRTFLGSCPQFHSIL